MFYAPVIVFISNLIKFINHLKQIFRIDSGKFQDNQFIGILDITT